MQAVQKANVTCGLSLGEYTALAFAGAFRYMHTIALQSCSSVSKLQSDPAYSFQVAWSKLASSRP